MELNLVFGDGKSIGAEGGNKMVGNAEEVCFIRAKEQDVVHVVIYGDGGVEGSKGVDKGGNVNLAKGWTVSHSLRKDLPVITGGGAGGVGGWEGESEARAVLGVKRDREETVFEIKNNFEGVCRESRWNRESRLGGAHGHHGGIDLAEVMEEAPSTRFLFNDKNGGVPRGSGGFNVTSLELLLDKGRSGDKFLRGEGPLRDPDGGVRRPSDFERGARVRRRRRKRRVWGRSKLSID